jgi:hypothetical protein
MPPATLIEELFGPVDYRRGQGRPLVNLRKAINTLLRGDLPSRPEIPIAPSHDSNDIGGRGTFFDTAQGLITTWTSNRTGPLQIFAARLRLDMPHARFNPVQQITESPLELAANPHATLLETGETLLVYEGTGGADNILMRRGTLATLPGAQVTQAVATAVIGRSPFAVAVGDQVLILWHQDPGSIWMFRRYDIKIDSFLTGATSLSTTPAPPTPLHAARDSTNTGWVAFSTSFTTGSEIIVVPVAPGAPPGPEQALSSSPGAVDTEPFVVVDHSDNAWVFRLVVIQTSQP